MSSDFYSQMPCYWRREEKYTSPSEGELKYRVQVREDHVKRPEGGSDSITADCRVVQTFRCQED